MKQRVQNLTQTISPKILAIFSVLLSYVLVFVPILTVGYELSSQVALTSHQGVAYLAIEEGIQTISECAVVQVEWTSRIYQGIFGLNSFLGFWFIFLPVFLWLGRYLNFYRPSILRFFLFVTALFTVPLLFVLTFLDNGLPSFCDYTPVVEVKYVYPFVPAFIIWIVNLFLSLAINKNIRLKENKGENEAGVEFAQQSDV